MWTCTLYDYSGKTVFQKSFTDNYDLHVQSHILFLS